MFLSILTPLTMKSRSNPRQLLYPCQMHPWYKFGDCRSLACRDNADIRIFYDVLKVGQGDLLFGVKDCSPICPCVQDPRFLCPAVTISGTILCHRPPLYIQTDRQTDRPTDSFCSEYMNISAGWLASWAKNGNTQPTAQTSHS